MIGVIKHNKLTDIPNYSYEGYIWMSDKNKPTVLNNGSFDFSKISINPFIIEGLLYSKKENISIHIQHTGEYQIFEYHLNDYTPDSFVEKEYLPHRLENVSKVKFKQIWLPEQDENCVGMEVLILKSIVFCGFKK
ncbi:MAG: TIGR04423 family type III CRISPR-associated protein [Paludibacter sp.]|nr:TIGR04423 family type III CRISPR-associated protein [Paludibacter sp.]